jgi:hypothetical protein
MYPGKSLKKNRRKNTKIKAKYKLAQNRKASLGTVSSRILDRNTANFTFLKLNYTKSLTYFPWNGYIRPSQK